MKRLKVVLSDSEIESLREKVRSGISPAREIAHARVLLGSHEGHPDKQIAREAGVSRATICRIRGRFVRDGKEAAVVRRAQPPRPNKRKLTDEGEARLIALACSEAPEGRARWTLRLLADRAAEIGLHLSHESVRQALKKTNSVLGVSSAG